MKRLILIQSSHCWTFKAFLALGLTIVSFALCPQLQATPDPGSVSPFNTADGDHANFSNTTGLANVAVGWYALFANTEGSNNTALGAAAGDFNTTGNDNTAVGTAALLLNTDGSDNTAVGVAALELNTGDNNTATGAFALFSNTTSNNTAIGANALLGVSTGDFNTALGANAGSDAGIGSNNVYVGDLGFPGDTNTIAIGGVPISGTDYTACYIGGISGATVTVDALPVFVDADGHLGTVAVGGKGTQPLRRGKNVQPQVRFNQKVEVGSNGRTANRNK